MINVYSYAKINLSLDVGDLMEDGYHQVDTIMQLVSLCDQVSVDVSESIRPEEELPEVVITCDNPQVPTDKSNLVYRAALLMYQKAREAGAGQGGPRTGQSQTEKVETGPGVGGPVPGRVSVHIRKRIPVAAGLAGGSGNAAAVIQALNILWNLNLTQEELCQIGGSIGADVAFCVSGHGAARGRGRGDVLFPCQSLDAHVVLVKPDFGVSTKEVYQGIDHCEIKERPDNDRLQALLDSSSQDIDIYPQMINVLEEYTLAAYPQVAEIKEDIIKNCPAAKKVLMSGSGPTVFALFDDEEKAKSCADTLMQNSNRGSNTVYLCRTL